MERLSVTNMQKNIDLQMGQILVHSTAEHNEDPCVGDTCLMVIPGNLKIISVQ